MIRVVNLKKAFNGQEVLRGVNLEVPKGEITTIIGRSGGGKSVFLKHLVGLLKPDSGEIYVDGVDITKLKGSALDKVKRKFGMVFQGAALFDSLTVLDNLAFPLRELTDLGEGEILKMVTSILERIGMAGMGDKYPDEISGGMKKRVGLARVIIMSPEYIFFDEPTTGLDPIVEKSIHQLMMQCREMVQCTDIVVSHNVREILKISDHVALLHEGRIIEVSSPEEIIRSEKPEVQEFFKTSVEGSRQLYRLRGWI